MYISSSHSPRTWRVVLGDHDIYNHEGTEQYMTVSQVYVHPSWNSNNVAGGLVISWSDTHLHAQISYIYGVHIFFK